MDIRDELDASFGDGPAHRPIDGQVRAGRKALRRRRVTTGVAALAVVGLVGGTSWLATAGTGQGDAPSDNGADTPVATAPSTTPTQKPSKAHDFVPTKADFLGEPAMIRSGDVYLDEGWREVRRMKNPMNYPPQHHSVAVEVRKGSQHKYMLLVEHDEGNTVSTSTSSADATDPMNVWLENAVAMQHTLDVDNGVVAADKVDAPLVTMAEDGTLTPRSDVKIIDQVTGIDLGPRFAGAQDVTAAALLDMPTGSDVYVVVRRISGSETEVIRGGTSKMFPSLEKFLEHAATKYSGQSNEGLR